MKITITIDAEEDGICPDEDIYEAIGNRITHVFLSEEIHKPDEWALLINSTEIKIERKESK